VRNLYISPTRSDNNSGSKENTFTSLERVRNAIRDSKKQLSQNRVRGMALIKMVP